MQNSVQKIKSIRFGSGILYLSIDNGITRINLGALKNAGLNVTKVINEMVFDNAKMPPKIKIDEAVFSANLYEIALENLQKIDGFAEYTSIDGSLKTITDETYGFKTSGDSFALQHKNGDNTQVSITNIKAGATALTADTDYVVSLDGNGNTIITILTAQTSAISVSYTYTPLASKQQIYRDIVKTLSMNRFKFENTDEEGNVFGIEFFEGFNRAGIEATFQPDDTTDDALNIPIEIKAFPVAGSQNMFRIYDEQDVD